MTSLQAFVHGFPCWLRSALKAAHMSQQNLADATGISKGHVSHIVRGIKSPNLSTVARIVDALAERMEAR